MFIAETLSVTDNASQWKDKIHTLSCMTFGKWLYEKRKARNITQTQLAERVGVSVSYISALERLEPGATGKDRRPSLELVDGLARALSYSKDEARIAAGYLPEQPFERPKPQTVEDLLQRLDELGIGTNFFGGAESLPDDPETLDAILQDFETVLALRARRTLPTNESNPRGLLPK